MSQADQATITLTPTALYVPALSPVTVTFCCPTGPHTGHLLGTMHFRGEALYHRVVVAGELFFVPPAWLDAADITAPVQNRRMGDLVGVGA